MQQIYTTTKKQRKNRTKLFNLNNKLTQLQQHCNSKNKQSKDEERYDIIPQDMIKAFFKYA
jgi:hypothetical protein